MLIRNRKGSVAQLVEHFAYNETVIGSSPVRLIEYMAEYMAAESFGGIVQ